MSTPPGFPTPLGHPDSLSQVPDEVLLAILGFCLLDPVHKRLPLLWRLCRVCRRWRYIIQASPTWWKDITVVYGLDVGESRLEELLCQLKLIGSCPVSFTFFYILRTEFTPSEDAKYWWDRMLSTCLQLAQQCDTLTVTCHSDQIHTILDHPMHQLRALTLIAAPPLQSSMTATDYNLFLPVSNFPRLSRVALGTIPSGSWEPDFITLPRSQIVKATMLLLPVKAVALIVNQLSGGALTELTIMVYGAEFANLCNSGQLWFPALRTLCILERPGTAASEQEKILVSSLLSQSPHLQQFWLEIRGFNNPCLVSGLVNLSDSLSSLTLRDTVIAPEEILDLLSKSTKIRSLQLQGSHFDLAEILSVLTVSKACPELELIALSSDEMMPRDAILSLIRFRLSPVTIPTLQRKSLRHLELKFGDTSALTDQDRELLRGYNDDWQNVTVAMATAQ